MKELDCAQIDEVFELQMSGRPRECRNGIKLSTTEACSAIQLPHS